jgi:hypothetical protein
MDSELIVLQVVGLSDGGWDTRHLDFEYYSRSQVSLEPNMLYVLRDLERRGLVLSVSIEGGTGPGWKLTSEGRRVLDGEDRSSR